MLYNPINMSFYHSAENIRIDDGCMLRARLQTADGDWNDSEINLDQCVGNANDQGHFTWDGQNFSQSAENIHFSLEGDGSVPVLRATLMDADGNGQERDLNLGERISNENGNFTFGMSL
ncbi:cyanovirin-N family [Pyrenophora seminiperda CCB06]|uniref:Cyanovirin-N family n=1 Tax=Pyrenophora seminiperda CCB06 TaxID=1302712 RepID=A0A3M7M8Q1_9PLEO|nr:cyanovirin-N family [Pyrenophora seminiperda CCB06]